MHSKRSDRPATTEPTTESSADGNLFNVVKPDAPKPPPEPIESAGGGDPPPQTPPEVHPEPPPDPFDPSRLRLRLDPGASLGIQKRLSFVPVRKPSKEWFIRTHPDRQNSWLETCVVELKEDRETYLVAPSLWGELAAESTFSPRLLVLAVSRLGTPFLWPIRLPGPDGKLDSWNASATEAAMLAQSEWVRVSANMELGAYDILTAPAIADEPTWPAEPLGELLRVAFRGKFIDSMDHPVLKRLRGEV